MSKKTKKKQSASSVLFVIILAFSFRIFMFEPFGIPSGSMKPNLLVGDYIFISKFSYGFSRFSIPFGPNLFSGRVFEINKPKQGDVIVFMLPSDNSVYYIKRLIGLPGDKVSVNSGILKVNGQEIPRTYEGIFTDSDNVKFSIYKESLPNGKQYRVLDYDNSNQFDDFTEITVPENHYFFLGDNRDRSLDSRSTVGLVPSENIVGKAQVIVYSSPYPIWDFINWAKNINFKRFFEKIN